MQAVFLEQVQKSDEHERWCILIGDLFRVVMQPCRHWLEMIHVREVDAVDSIVGREFRRSTFAIRLATTNMPSRVSVPSRFK